MRLPLSTFNEPVYLAPFTAEAVLMYHVLQSHSIQVAGFLDNSACLHGKSYKSCEIFSSKKFEDTFSKECTTILLCAFKYYSQLEAQFSKQTTIRLDQIYKSDYIDTALSQIDKDAFHSLAPKQIHRASRLPHIMPMYALPDDTHAPNPFIIDEVTFPLTDRCSLRCAGCGDLMPYFNHPQDFELSCILENIRVICQKVDYIRCATLVGGEPFLRQDILPEILKTLQDAPNIGAIELITNATLPLTVAVLSSLQQSKAYIRVTQYPNSRHLDTLIADMKKWGIYYRVRNFSSWFDIRRPTKKNVDGLAQRFFECEAKRQCSHIRDGFLYICPFIANGEALGLFPPDNKNHLNLMDPSTTTETIRQFWNSESIPPACAYCNGGSISKATPIPVAQQLKKPIPYRPYRP